jgi:pyruvate dehydrogenase phosphatase
MDGHGGYDTSQLLSKTLVKAAALKLNALNAQPAEPSLFSKLLGTASPTRITTDTQANPDLVSRTIQNAFTEFDDEILKAPMRILADNWSEELRKQNKVPDLSQHPLGLPAMLPALSGMVTFALICLCEAYSNKVAAP